MMPEASPSSLHATHRPRNSPRRRLAGAAALLALLLPGAGQAQTEPDTFRLERLVVTATKLPLPQRAVPAHVTVLPGVELRARGIARVTDALRDAGIGAVAQLGSTGGVSSLFLRGGESDYVQVLVDGVQVNDPGGAFDWAHLSTADIDRIEIVRGPVSVLYGSDAVAGVVQIFTRAGTGAPRIDAQLTGGRSARVGTGASGTFTTWQGSATVSGRSGGASRSAAWGFTAARENSEGAYAFNNEYDNTTLAGRTRLALGSATALQLTGRYVDQRFHYPTDGAGNIVDRNRYTLGEARTLSALLERRLTDAVRAQLTLATYRNQTGGEDPADEPGQGFSRSSARVRRDAAELRVDASPVQPVLVSMGIELERQEGRTSFQSDGPFGPFSDASDADRDTRAGYAQAVARFGRAGITVGGRIDDSEQFGTFTTGRAGVTYEAGRVLLHAAYGSGFKEPTFFETYATGFARGNPDLQPEQSRSGELGVTLTGSRASISATAFAQRFTNLIQYTAAPPDAEAPNYFNVGEAEANGLELGGESAIHGRVRVSASYTWLDTEVLDEGFGADRQFARGERLLRRPEHQGTAGVEWRAHPRLQTSLQVHYVGARDDLDFTDPVEWQGLRVRLPAHTTGDATLNYVVPLRGSEAGVQLRVQNLWQERYAEVYNFPQPGRSVSLGVRMGLQL